MSKTSEIFLKVGLVVAAMVGLFFYFALESQEDKKKVDFSQVKTQQGLVQYGRYIFFGKGRCDGCHTLGRIPTTQRAPELYEVGDRLTREFMRESLTDPEAYVKKNFDPPEPTKYSMTMPVINRPPIGLDDNEMLAVIAFLQSQGGKVTVSPADLTPAKGR
jgi:cbb3-type cytochrome oxidase cytochrome c subunit